MHKYAVSAGVVAAGLVALAITVAVTTPSAPRTAAPRTATQAVPAAEVPVANPSTGPDLAPLTDMTKALSTTAHNVMMKTQGSAMTGSVMPEQHLTQATAKASGLEIGEIVDHGDIYLQVDLGTELNSEIGVPPTTWMKLDPAKIHAQNELLIQADGADPVDLAGIMKGITTLRQAGPDHVAGTLNLTKVHGHTVPDSTQVSKAGPAANSVPFSASADAKGRITVFHVDTTAFDPTLSLDVRYTSYGDAAPISPPPASIPAPDSVYAVFND
jgi:hypothetical protein